MNPELLKILCCPESRQPLAEADPAMIKAINARIQAGRLHSRGGQAVTEPLEGALVRQDHQILYPLRRGIPVLLVDEAIALREIEST